MEKIVYEIDNGLLDKVVGYLQKRPFVEVAGLINEISSVVLAQRKAQKDAKLKEVKK